MEIKMSDIQKGWKRVTISDVAKVVTGKTPPTANPKYYSGSILFVSPGDLAKEKYILETEKTLTSEGAKHSPVVPKGSILFTCIGSTIGKIGIAEVDLCTNQQINSVIPDKINSEYLYYALSHLSKKVKRIAVVQAVPIINKTDFENLIIYIPRDSDTINFIANTLQTWDTAIEKTEALIAAKERQFEWLKFRLLKNIEKHSETKLIPLGQLLNYEQPTKYIVKSTEYIDQGTTPVLTANQSFILGYTNEQEGVFDKYPVIIFDDFTTDIKYVDFPFKVKSSAMKILCPKNKMVDMGYIFASMSTIKTPLGGHKRYWISEYQFFHIPLPPLDEQKRIAHILNTAQHEISLLKQLTEKYRLQKRGLMQKLMFMNYEL